MARTHQATQLHCNIMTPLELRDSSHLQDGLPIISPDKGETENAANLDDAHRYLGMVPVVGLGGSAGSITALRSFFTAMPPNPGLAFVVILHLAPDHHSTMPELLARSTSMKVLQPQTGNPVEANCVYVIPPGKFLTLSNNRFVLDELQPMTSRRVVVDLFFRTLADTHGTRSTATPLGGRRRRSTGNQKN